MLPIAIMLLSTLSLGTLVTGIRWSPKTKVRLEDLSKSHVKRIKKALKDKLNGKENFTFIEYEESVVGKKKKGKFTVCLGNKAEEQAGDEYLECTFKCVKNPAGLTDVVLKRFAYGGGVE